MAFSLILLGTDTYYLNGTQPVDNPADANFQKFGFMPNGETLSTVYDAIRGQGAVISRASREAVKPAALLDGLQDKEKVLFEGPDTLGSHVGDIIARATLVCLEKLAAGERLLNISGHSRGAVQSILVCHEIDRILNEIAQYPDKPLAEILTNSPCRYTKAAMEKLLISESAICDRINNQRKQLPVATDINISLYTVDPVPGGSYAGLHYFGLLAWRDDRFYTLPACVKTFTERLMEGERSRCFKPIVPEPKSGTATSMGTLPGNHGTASGNPRGQQNEKIFADDSPKLEAIYAIQKVCYIELIEQHEKMGTQFNPALHQQILKNTSDDLTTQKFKNLTVIAEHKKDLDIEYTKYYYFGLGQEEHVLFPLLGAIRIPLIPFTRSRIIHLLNANNSSLQQSKLNNANGYANKQHHDMVIEQSIDATFAKVLDASVPLKSRLDHFMIALMSTSAAFSEQARQITEVANRFIQHVALSLSDVNTRMASERDQLVMRITSLLKELKTLSLTNPIYQGVYDKISAAISNVAPIIIDNYRASYQAILNIAQGEAARLAMLKTHAEQLEDAKTRFTLLAVVLDQSAPTIEATQDLLLSHSNQVENDIAASEAAIASQQKEKIRQRVQALRNAEAQQAQLRAALINKRVQFAGNIEKLMSGIAEITSYLEEKRGIFSGKKHISHANDLLSNAEIVKKQSLTQIKQRDHQRFFEINRKNSHEEEAYLTLVAMLQAQFNIALQQWIKKYGSNKTMTDYIDYLNKHQNRSHYNRKISLLLRDSYDHLEIKGTPFERVDATPYNAPSRQIAVQ
jgi:hypothetical protein